MSPLFFLILSLIDLSQSVPLAEEDQADPFLDDFEPIFGPKLNAKMPVVIDDIAQPDTLTRNAHPCIAIGCLWPKTGSVVNVPYVIHHHYTAREKRLITEALRSFSVSTCIRFVPWQPEHEDFIYIISGEWCWSHVGRQGGPQYVSLQSGSECMGYGTVQHEMLHALGLTHEQNRSDRDFYIRILEDNIQPENLDQFVKVQTNNLGTPYDFNSIMQYGNYAFSKNGNPTMVAKHDPTLQFGTATEMDYYDITRIKRLYKC